jgi:enoyl-CoA hydratase/carnithine racemase
MAYDTLLLEAGDGVGIITINRPDVRNAVNGRVVTEMRAALDELREDSTVSVVVFTGVGEKAFVAGADITELRGRTITDGLAAKMQRLFDEIESLEKPTVAAVNGYAFGGGCELAMACDIRVASQNARFGLPETSLSIIPAAGGTQRLARLVGKGRAVEMILTGRPVGAEEALNIGLVSRVVPQEALMDAVREIAGQILSKGPLAIRLAKLAVHSGFDADQRTGEVIERLAQTVLYASEDKQEGTTAFLEKRTPKFEGR